MRGVDHAGARAEQPTLFNMIPEGMNGKTSCPSHYIVFQMAVTKKRNGNRGRI